VTEDSLIIKSAEATPVDTSNEDDEDEDPLRDPEASQPTFTYWSALWRRPE